MSLHQNEHSPMEDKARKWTSTRQQPEPIEIIKSKLREVQLKISSKLPLLEEARGVYLSLKDDLGRLREREQLLLLALAADEREQERIKARNKTAATEASESAKKLYKFKALIEEQVGRKLTWPEFMDMLRTAKVEGEEDSNSELTSTERSNEE